MKKIIALILIIGIVLTYIFAFNMKAAVLVDHNLRAYNPEDFTDASSLTNTNRLVASNEDFELYIDETTSYFKVVDLRNGEVYLSNPDVEDPWISNPDKQMTTSAIEKQKATLEIQYFNQSGSLTTINNYKYSIYHPASILNEEGERTFGIKYIDNGVQVKYVIEDLEVDYLYFPKYLPKDVMENMEQFDILNRIAYTGYDEERELYEIVQYQDMSRLVKRRLYDIFYKDMDYTRERSIEENESYGYFEQFEKVRFEIAVEIALTDEGVRTTILRDSIVENEATKIARVSLYPLFGTAVSVDELGDPTDGYIVLPDGSGAIIDFNNGKYFQNAYNKRLYGQDLTQLPYKMAEQQQKIAMPVYGMVKENGGFAAIITEGDAMAWLNADVSERIDSYNKVFTSFSFREVESVVIGSGFNQYGVDLWTEEIVKTDFSVEYTFLTGEYNSYVGIAQAFKNYLEDRYGLSTKDQTTNTVLTTEFIGAYDRKEFFLGVPYYTNESMTTFDQAQEIIGLLNDKGLETLNVLYQGAINGGLTQDLNDRVDFERTLGGKKDYEALEAYLESLNIDLYQSVNIVTAKDYHKAFDQFRYTANRIRGSHALMFNYHYPSRLPYSETPFEHSSDSYVINPLYYEAIFNRMNKDYTFDNLEMSLMGSMIAGHYSDDMMIYQQYALWLQERFLDSVDQGMMLNNPLYYAFEQASYITELPVEATLYSIIDDQIPLLQLVLSGVVDYSSSSINLANDRSVQYQFLKHIETGSNLKYTLTYDDSRELLNTEYNYYMATDYRNWLDTIESQVKELDAIGIHHGTLINHERVGQNVYRVIYSHGLTILINYNLRAVTIGTNIIPSLSYYIEEV
jgi:glutaredoxin-related protein